MPFLLWGGVLVFLLLLGVVLPRRKAPEFGFAALALLSWLTIFAFMSGFSIGLYVTWLNILLGFIFVFSSPHYRPQLAFVLAVNILFAFAFIPLVYWLLVAVVSAALLLSITRLSGIRKDKDGMAQLLLAIVAILFFLSLMLLYSPPIAMILAVLAGLVGLSAIFISRKYWVYLAFVTLTTLTWASTLYWQSTFGV